mgnify:CR=1 FL=1
MRRLLDFLIFVQSAALVSLICAPAVSRFCAMCCITLYAVYNTDAYANKSELTHFSWVSIFIMRPLRGVAACLMGAFCTCQAQFVAQHSSGKPSCQGGKFFTVCALEKILPYILDRTASQSFMQGAN